MFAMIVKHVRNILRGDGRRRGAYIGHYLSFVASRRENGLLDMGDLALPLLEAGEKLLELPCLFSLPMFFSGLTVCLECLVQLLRDLLQIHNDDVLRFDLERNV
jgi:hypothetical protein